MKNYYFTFGDQYQTDGTLMRDYWIRVISDDWMAARIRFINEFSSIYMHRPTEWSFQYTDEDFEPHYFPKGEYLLIQ